MQTVEKIAVRQLLEFVLRHGSLDNRFCSWERAHEGARIHRKLQKTDQYYPEVPLALEVSCGEFVIVIEGKADGVVLTDGQVTIDEIKATYIPLSDIHEDDYPLHWAQGMSYAYMYAKTHDLAEVGVQLTYYHAETSEIRRFRRHFTYQALEDAFYVLINKFMVWVEYKMQWQAKRNESVSALPFPFDRYRRGQRELAVAVYKTITAEETLFVQAPTGIGKTMSVLYPAIKALCAQKIDKVFYLTAKTITRQAAEEAVHKMRQHKAQLKSVTLTAKDKICLMPKTICNPDNCPYADGHYDRINDAVYSLLAECDHFNRDTIQVHAVRHQVCPFELSLDLSLWCDVVICDYNYLFDPQASLKRYFAQPARNNYVFLIDEAHNLVQRARDMYSATLKKSSFLQLKKELNKISPKLARVLGTINTSMVQMRKLCDKTGLYVAKELHVDFCKQLDGFLTAFEECRQTLAGYSCAEDLQTVYFEVLAYQKIAALYDGHYVTLIHSSSRDLSIKLFCLDPAQLLRECIRRGKAAIFFSATLTPLDYFSAVLGGSDSAKKMALPSPFAERQQCLLIAGGISTKLKNRPDSKSTVVEIIYAAVYGKKGNYLVFLPSYQYLQDIYEEFTMRYPNVKTLMQAVFMSEEEREAFLDCFHEGNQETMVGFAVLGGIFSEGIDLAGKRLIGTIIVGVGLPQISAEQDLLRDYYEEYMQRGYEFAYLYPGMNKVLQAAGRVIRSEEDHGVVILIDDRYLSSAYLALFPPHWSHYRVVRTSESLAGQLRSFWQLTGQTP